MGGKRQFEPVCWGGLTHLDAACESTAVPATAPSPDFHPTRGRGLRADKRRSQCLVAAGQAMGILCGARSRSRRPASSGPSSTRGTAHPRGGAIGRFASDCRAPGSGMSACHRGTSGEMTFQNGGATVLLIGESKLAWVKISSLM